MTGSVDAVVIGAGPNGLVAAALLADAGWDVEVLEAADEPGGAVRSAEVTAPGFSTDLFSAFYPLTGASPVIEALDLEAHGLRWSHAPAVVANPRPDGPAAVLYRDPGATAVGLGVDEAAWLELHDLWEQVGEPLLAALLSPFPPVRAGARLAVRARRRVLDLARMTVLPVRRLVAERFHGPEAGLLLTGNALHADLMPESAPSALLGWLLCSLGQTVGFPVPVGGAGQLSAALAHRARSAGARLTCGATVERIELVGGRPAIVHHGRGRVAVRRAVVAGCDAEILYHRLLPPGALPEAFARKLELVQRGGSTVKVNWALSRPVPWRDHRVAPAGTVHVADSLDELTMSAAELACGRVPERPFLVMGQMTTSDATRSPAGTESAWAYTHVPQGSLVDRRELAEFVARMEARVEEHAPGFGDEVLARHVQGPADLEAADPSLIGGDIGGGTAQLHQQLVFRPVPGLGRAETPIPGLYLGSASAHPGGAVHGAAGANAARAALWHDRLARARASLSRAVPGRAT